MTTSSDIERKAKHLLYLLVNEQKLRAGDSLQPQVLQHLLERNQFGEQDRQLAVEYAREQGWLQYGPNDEVQLTEQGFAVD